MPRSLTLIFLLMTSVAYAQVQSPIVAAGSTTPRSAAARAADVINVADYGAVCDGVTDDAAHINAAIAAFRSDISTTGAAKLIWPGAVKCLIKSTLNFTGMTSFFGVIDMSGAILVCQTSGTPCIDETGSAHFTWESPNVQGLSTNSPSVGFQMARSAASNACGEQRIDNLKLTGYFTFAALYNVACETVTFISPHIENDYSGAGYAVIQDGINHFGLSSAFVTVTLPANTANSFNENAFFNATVVGEGTVPPTWMSGTIRHRWYASYGLTLGPHYSVALYDNNVNPNQMLYFDAHEEGNALTDIFLVTGSNATPILYGLSYIDQQGQPSSAYFALDTGVTGATIVNAEINIIQPSLVVALFATPSAWTVNGNIQVGTNNTTTASQIGFFQGQFCKGGSCQLYETSMVAISGNSTQFVMNNSGTSQASISMNNSAGVGTWQLGEQTGTTPNWFLYCGPCAANLIDASTSGGMNMMENGGPMVMLGPFQLLNSTVAGLGTCNAQNIYQLEAVSDALAPTWNATLVGGGTVSVIAYCNGSHWTAH